MLKIIKESNENNYLENAKRIINNANDTKSIIKFLKSLPYYNDIKVNNDEINEAYEDYGSIQEILNEWFHDLKLYIDYSENKSSQKVIDEISSDLGSIQVILIQLVKSGQIK